MAKNRVTVELNIENFLILQNRKGWNESETADKIGCSPEQLWKIKKKKHNPGPDFIAGVLNAFPDVSFDAVFILSNSLRSRKSIGA